MVSFCFGVKTNRGELYGVITLWGRQAKYFSEQPSRGDRKALKDYSDNEAVRPRKQDLVSTHCALYVFRDARGSKVKGTTLCGTVKAVFVYISIPKRSWSFRTE